MELTTVTYIRSQNKILMLHRVKEENDPNKGKWLGVGGHLEAHESPVEAAKREIKEECGLDLEDLFFQGIVTFVSPGQDTSYIFVYRARTTKTKVSETSEGVLAWIDVDKILELNLWAGDRYFLPLVLQESEDFFSLKTIYDANGNLIKYYFD